MARAAFLEWEAELGIYKVGNDLYRDENVFYFRGVIQAFSYAFFIFFISLIDGLPSQNKLLRRAPIVAGMSNIVITCFLFSHNLFWARLDYASFSKTFFVFFFFFACFSRANIFVFGFDATKIDRNFVFSLCFHWCLF